MSTWPLSWCFPVVPGGSSLPMASQGPPADERLEKARRAAEGAAGKAAKAEAAAALEDAKTKAKAETAAAVKSAKAAAVEEKERNSGRAAPAEKKKAKKKASEGSSDDWKSKLPDDNMEIPHPDGLKLGEYANHLYRIFQFQGKEPPPDGKGGNYSGMTLALIRFNIMEQAEEGKLWLPPTDWMPIKIDDTRLTIVSFNTTLGLVMNEDPNYGRTMVKRLLPNSPATKRGVLPGMFLLTVNGEEVSDKHYKEIKCAI